MVLGLRQFSHRTGDAAGEPVLDANNGEELIHVQPGVAIALGSRAPEAPGTLYISTHQVIWLSDVERNKGYAVDFLSISLHAVSRDPEAYPSPCIYAQIETVAEEEGSDGSDSEYDETLDLSKVKEMRLVPSDPTQLDTLFEVFCECAELNPEPSEEEGEGGGHDWVFSADSMEREAGEGEEPDWHSNPTTSIGYSNGEHELAQNVLELQIHDQRFEDAEEMEHQESNSGHH
ncbi:chloride conductance regulatory protein ICln isoform X1 [Rhodamnia argentea]|uniref:Chloride conductance regulatory protein ICln isoform X1 n=1 Tax=Rhodamnia argentea TaxID=178133 RepID=A0A8B8PNY4_9MYRT|nr:chloride conductance regulatory protein ICln isoform X1 [Rhodamnia argentea]